ncbi:MAG TPA: universal stress protein [Thermoanaerobaculia bacterium]
MLQIRTVLCPVDFTDVNTRELDQALEICRSFGSRLILHHNVSNIPPTASVSWMYHQEHPSSHSPEEMATRKLRALLATLPPEVRPEARLSNGGTASSILSAEERVHADLVVLATHGPTTDDHTSVAEQIADESNCPVLVLHDGIESILRLASDHEILDVLVPTDFSPSGQSAMSYAFELARLLPLRIHILHVLPVSGNRVWGEYGPPIVGSQLSESEDSDELYLRLGALVPDDLQNLVSLYVEVGEPVHKIMEASYRLGAACIIMGTHARGFLRRIFTRDTSREVLRQATCPVWVVPEKMAA